jgi:hypothetical protein
MAHARRWVGVSDPHPAVRICSGGAAPALRRAAAPTNKRATCPTSVFRFDSCRCMSDSGSSIKYIATCPVVRKQILTSVLRAACRCDGLNSYSYSSYFCSTVPLRAALLRARGASFLDRVRILLRRARDQERHACAATADATFGHLRNGSRPKRAALFALPRGAKRMGEALAPAVMLARGSRCHDASVCGCAGSS